MVISLANVFLLHCFVGVGMALVTVVFFLRLKRRRPIFRFGGDDVLSLGSLKNWAVWYVVGFTFEFLTSFLTHQLYTELALSMFEALALSVGLFIVDRISMAFEPESYWKSKTTSIPAAEPTAPTPTADVPKASPANPSSNQEDNSWIGKKIERGMAEVHSIPKAISRARQNHEDAEKRDDEESRRGIRDRLHDDLKGF